MKKTKKELHSILESYDFIEDISGKSIINLLKTVDILRSVYNSLFCEHGISESKFYVLLLLYKQEGGMPLSEIGLKMLVTKPNITGLIERMEKEGLVEKKINENDKRSTLAILTKDGKELYEKVRDCHINFTHQITKILDLEEKQIINTLLEKLQKDVVDCFTREEQDA